MKGTSECANEVLILTTTRKLAVSHHDFLLAAFTESANRSFAIKLKLSLASSLIRQVNSYQIESTQGFQKVNLSLTSITINSF
jgi:hypothetical protein